MRGFHCGQCGLLASFEDTQCVRCSALLRYLPAAGELAALADDGAGNWLAQRDGVGQPEATRYRRCRNDEQHGACNWALDANDANPFCRSCRFTRTLPDLADPARRTAWIKLEQAKRRLLHALIDYRLPLATKAEDPAAGLAFDFLADEPAPPGVAAAPTLTGHDHGLITINIAEADDVERERRRHALHEEYRTLLGHFRHEVGHCYWDRLLGGADAARRDAFRAAFGNERADYGAALARHHRSGPPADWAETFVSAYASSHPWEDWAETWAHYLHMADAVESAADCGLSLQPSRSGEPAFAPVPGAARRMTFDEMAERWFPLSYMMNCLNRCVGLPDAYPFLLNSSALAKLRFVHETIAQAGIAAPAPPAIPANK